MRVPCVAEETLRLGKRGWEREGGGGEEEVGREREQSLICDVGARPVTSSGSRENVNKNNQGPEIWEVICFCK